MILNRTKNAARNIFWGLIQKLVYVILAFITRTVFIKILGAQYLGLSALCESILNTLNIAELGFGTAIVFSMYKPIAEDDTETLCALQNVYKKIYHAVGTLILLIGLIILPFLPTFIKGEPPNGINIYIIYLLYLAHSVLGYFLYAYKTALFSAYQRQDIESKRALTINSLGQILRIITLIVTHNFYIFVLIIPLTTIASNLYNAYYAKKIYPQIVCRGTINKDIKVGILKRIVGVLSNRIFLKLFSSINSIIISTYIGLVVLGIYNNYLTILTIFTSILIIIEFSITAGIGNRMNTDSVEQNYTDFGRITFGYAFMVSFFSIILLCILQHFMLVWLGKELLFPIITTLLLIVYFYFDRLEKIVITYRSAAGLWWEDRFRPIIAVIFNLILALSLVKSLGVSGVILSLILCHTIINLPWGIHILFKYYFKRSKMEYYKSLLFYTIVTIIVGATTYYLCSLLHHDDGILYLILKGIICTTVAAVLLILFYCRTKEFQYSVEFLSQHLSPYLAKFKKNS